MLHHGKKLLFRPLNEVFGVSDKLRRYVFVIVWDCDGMGWDKMVGAE